jgi:hypothetical protein
MSSRDSSQRSAVRIEPASLLAPEMGPCRREAREEPGLYGVFGRSPPLGDLPLLGSRKWMASSSASAS